MADREPAAGSLRAADLGISFLVAVLACGAAGYALDHLLGSKPWGLLIGLFMGFAAWLWQMWKVFKSTQAK